MINRSVCTLSLQQLFVKLESIWVSYEEIREYISKLVA